MIIPDTSLILPEPWYWCNSEALLNELYKELSPGHILKKRKLKTVARRQDRDDVLFEIIDDNNGYAIVHLTWNVETAPAWPHTTIYNSWDEVWKVIQADALEFD